MLAVKWQTNAMPMTHDMSLG